MNERLKGTKSKKNDLDVNVDELNDAISTLNKASQISERLGKHHKHAKSES